MHRLLQGLFIISNDIYLPYSPWNVTNMTMSIKVTPILLPVIVVGDASVGKTNIIHCYSKGKIANNTMPTVGVEYASKIIPLKTNNG